VYAASESVGPEAKPPLSRGTVVFGGFLIKPIGNNKSHVTLIWCSDHNKVLKTRYNDEESKRTALRLCRIKKMIDDAATLVQRTADYARQKASSST